MTKPSPAVIHEREIADQLDARIDELEEALRTVAVAVPVNWQHGNASERRAYRVLSDFLIADQGGRSR
jgi:hypothetical protein